VYDLLASARDDFEVAGSFDPDWLPSEKHRIALAMELAVKVENFANYLPRFAIHSSVAYREIVALTLTAPASKALRHARNLKLSDAELLAAYFTVRSAQPPRVGRDGTQWIYDDLADPIRMLQQMARLYFPEAKRPGFQEPDRGAFEMTLNYPTGETVTIYDGETEGLIRGVDSKQEEALAVAASKPDFLPKTWVEMAYKHYGDGAIASELIRQCYRLSRPDDLYSPIDSMALVLRSLGLDPGDWRTQDYAYALGKNLHVEILSLQRHMPEPVFADVAVEPALYAPPQAQSFLEFLRELRARIHYASNMFEWVEWDEWLRLREGLNLRTTGVTVENIAELTAQLRKRPPVTEYRSLPLCHTVFR
jgi:hypothetical protein